MVEQTAVKNRVTVVELVYYREFGEEASVVETRYSRDVEGDDQPYTRRIVATEEWTVLDTGWITSVGTLIIQNPTGRFLQVNPTEEEKRERAEEVAKCLSNQKIWHSHGRNIGVNALRDIVKLKIEDYSDDDHLRKLIRSYNDLITDYIRQKGFSVFLHSRES